MIYFSEDKEKAFLLWVVDTTHGVDVTDLLGLLPLLEIC